MWSGNRLLPIRLTASSDPRITATTMTRRQAMGGEAAADRELVAKADKLQLFMRDHGKPFDVSGMTAKATLLAGSDKQEVQLQPVDGKLEAAGNFKVASGTKAVVAVSKVGKAVASVRFTLK